jgi:hypothetical protein
MVKVIVSLQAVAAVDEALLEFYKRKYPGNSVPSYESLERPIINQNFRGRKNWKIVNELLSQSELWEKVTPREGALWALHAMRTSQVDVRLLVSYVVSAESVCWQIAWVLRHVGADWISRIIVSTDRSTLSADFLVEPHPFPLKCVVDAKQDDECERDAMRATLDNAGAPIATAASWNHIVFAQPYNRMIHDRMMVWGEWKQRLGLNEQVEVGWIHGSPDSTDRDVVYLFDKLPPHKECVKFCHGNTEDRNMISLRDGVVYECYKGPVDEVNNALFHTIPMHEQSRPMPIARRVRRTIMPKLIGAIRSIFVKLRRTVLREIVLPGISGDFEHLLRSFEAIRFQHVELDSDTAKHCAFQLGQTMGLIQGRELYTKGEVGEMYPPLLPLLRRESTASAPLDEMRERMIEMMRGIRVVRLGKNCGRAGLVLVDADAPTKSDAVNFFKLESNRLVFDLSLDDNQKESVACFAFEHANPWDQPSWPTDASEATHEGTAPRGEFVLVFVHRGDVCVVPADARRSALRLKLDGIAEWLVFTPDFRLVAARDALTQTLLPAEVVARTAERLGVEHAPQLVPRFTL